LQVESFIDFQWPRDPQKRFELIPAHSKKNPRAGQREKNWFGETGKTEPDLIPAPATIVWTGTGELPYYEPFQSSGIVEVFVAVRTPDQALNFIKEFGHLREWAWEHGEQVSRVLDTAAEFRQIAEFNNRKGPQATAKHFEIWQSVQVYLGPAPADEGASVRYRVRDLESAIMLRFMLDIAGGVTLRICARCQTMFSAGPGHRRAHAKFCSDTCQIKFKSEPKPRKRTARRSKP
jgi:hypothetical protein